RITLARLRCAGLSSRTGGVFTDNVVSIVTASASAARATGAPLATASATHAPIINEERSNSFTGKLDISPSTFVALISLVASKCRHLESRPAPGLKRKSPFDGWRRPQDRAARFQGWRPPIE